MKYVLIIEKIMNKYKIVNNVNIDTKVKYSGYRDYDIIAEFEKDIKFALKDSNYNNIIDRLTNFSILKNIKMENIICRDFKSSIDSIFYLIHHDIEYEIYISIKHEPNPIIKLENIIQKYRYR